MGQVVGWTVEKLMFFQSHPKPSVTSISSLWIVLVGRNAKTILLLNLSNSAVVVVKFNIIYYNSNFICIFII